MNYIRSRVLSLLFHLLPHHCSALGIFLLVLLPDLNLISLVAHVLPVLGVELLPDINCSLGNESTLLKSESSGFETSYSERSKTSFNILSLQGRRRLLPPEFDWVRSCFRHICCELSCCEL